MHESGATAEDVVANDSCLHYWLIESPEGSTSPGVCKLCGATDVFKNSIPSAQYIYQKRRRRFNPLTPPSEDFPHVAALKGSQSARSRDKKY